MVLLASALLAFLYLQAQRFADPLDVSLIQLISSPDKFDGKLVRVEGFLRLEFEGEALYLHQEDDEQMLTKNAIWIDASPDMMKKRDSVNKKYVLLEGTFDAKNHGHMALFSGSLHAITRADAMPSRSDLQRMNERAKDREKQK